MSQKVYQKVHSIL